MVVLVVRIIERGDDGYVRVGMEREGGERKERERARVRGKKRRMEEYAGRRNEVEKAIFRWCCWSMWMG